MAANIINKIVLQDELPIILTVEISHETQIKGHHVYKDIWAPELGEHLEVQCEPENPVDKYAVCLKTSNGTIVGHLKKGKSGRFAKTIFYHLRSHPQVNCTPKDLILVMASVFKSPVFCNLLEKGSLYQF